MPITLLPKQKVRTRVLNERVKLLVQRVASQLLSHVRCCYTPRRTYSNNVGTGIIVFYPFHRPVIISFCRSTREVETRNAVQIDTLPAESCDLPRLIEVRSRSFGMFRTSCSCEDSLSIVDELNLLPATPTATRHNSCQNPTRGVLFYLDSSNRVTSPGVALLGR